MDRKYFSVDVWDFPHEIVMCETLEEAKNNCLECAIAAYDDALGTENLQKYEECDLPEAVYGVVLGYAESNTRPFTKEELESGDYVGGGGYCIESPKLVEVNGWISVKDKLPEIETNVLGLCNVLDKQLILIVSREVADGEYWFSPVGFDGVNNDEAVEVTHWQPLPNRPKS